MNLFGQFLDEISNTAYPGPADVFKTVVLMVLIGGLSSFVILNADAFLKDLYIGWGFIPDPTAEKIDYSETMTLPPDWEKDLNDLSGIFSAATKGLGIKAQEVAPSVPAGGVERTFEHGPREQRESGVPSAALRGRARNGSAAVLLSSPQSRLHARGINTRRCDRE